MSVNFLRVEPMSKEQLRKAFNKVPKDKLIDMLIECNRILGNVQENYPSFPEAINCDTITTASNQYWDMDKVEAYNTWANCNL